MSSYSLTLAFIDPSLEKHAEHTLAELKVRGATWIHGHGTCASPALCFLGLDNPRKTILMVLHRSIRTTEICGAFAEQLALKKRGHGIVVSLPVVQVLGLVSRDPDATTVSYKGESTMNQQMIVVIVDKNRGDDVVEAAQKAGAPGATVLHGRGSGAEKVEHFLHLEIEPEKEIVLIAAESDDVQRIIDGINGVIHFDAPNTGILFTLAITESAGMSSRKK